MRKLEGQERADLYKVFGGTNTPKRRSWQAQMRRGRQEGWYRPFQGEIATMERGRRPSAQAHRRRGGQRGWYRRFQREIATMEPGPHATVQVQLKTATGPARAQ